MYLSPQLVFDVFVSLKRALKIMSCTPEGISKCGEVFVTDIGDKWTFFCAYCEKATNDIGNFICHIRLNHFNDPQRRLLGNRQPSVETEIKVSTVASSIQSYTNSSQPMPTIQIAGDFPTKEIPIVSGQQHLPPQREIYKETIVSNQENLPTISKSLAIDLTQPEYNIKVYKANTNFELLDQVTRLQSTTNNENNINKSESLALTTLNQETELQLTRKNENDIQNLEYLVLTTVDQETQSQSATKNENDIQIVYTQAECMTCDETDIDSDTDSIHKPNNEEPKINMMIKPEYQYLFPYKCKICNWGFKTKGGKSLHMTKLHQCDECNKILTTPRGLRNHKMSHNKKSHYTCPVCPTNLYKQSLFITHVLTHESSTCFPCQVCGKIYKTNLGRKKHWESHAKEKPFACDICYRRYPNQQYLTQHQKSHNKYQCNFCATEFNSDYAQLPPYACEECKELPDIKESVEHL